MRNWRQFRKIFLGVLVKGNKAVAGRGSGVQSFVFILGWEVEQHADGSVPKRVKPEGDDVRGEGGIAGRHPGVGRGHGI